MRRRLSVTVRIALWIVLILASMLATRSLILRGRAELAFQYGDLQERLAVAPGIDPASAEYARSRGDFWLEAAIPPRPDLAAFEYRRAVESNPREAAHWINWARVCRREGHADEAEEAYAMAVRLDPNNYRGHYELGNFLLERNRLDEAMAHHAQALRFRPRLARSLYSLYWNLGQSPNTVAARLLGDNPRFVTPYLLDCLAWAGPAESVALWDSLAAHPALLDATCYRAWFDYLIDNAMFARAADVWNEIARRFYGRGEGWQRAFPEDVVFWNGSFDLPLRFVGGLEWRLPRLQQMPKGAQVVVRSLAGPNNDNRALWIHFDGSENVAFAHVRHLCLVEPNAAYRLRFNVKSLGLTTDSRPYVRIRLIGRPEQTVNGEMVTGGGGDMEQTFSTPPECHAVEFAICRDPIRKLDNKIKGDVWYDDFRLERIGGVEAKEIAAR